MFFGSNLPEKPEPEVQVKGYYECELSTGAREFVLKLVDKHGPQGKLKEEALSALRLGRWMPLDPDSRLSFADLEREAKKRGTDILDAWFDLISRREASRDV